VIRTARCLLLALVAAALGCAGASSGPARPAAAAGAPTAKQPASRQPAAKPGAASPGPAEASAASPAAPASTVVPPQAGMDSLPPRAQRLFAEAVQAEQDLDKQKLPKDWPLLERRWRAVLEAADLAEAHYDLGVALENQGRLDEARAEYERARALKPGLRQAAVNLGVLLERAGDLRGAQAAYAAVVRDFPEDARARERLAALYLGSGQLDEAWQLAREALLRDPRSVNANKVMLQVATRRNQLDLAKLIALRTAKLDPADPELPFRAGDLAARENDDAGAEAQFKKALALDPHYLPARSALLRAAIRRGRWTAAAEQAQALLQDRPDDPAVQLALGIALRHTEKPDDALAAYARAEQLSGDKLPEVHLARGVLFMQVKNECEPALEEFRKYTQAAGPMAATESPVLKLQHECETILDENRKALEAAKEMQRSAEEKKAAAKPKEGTAPAEENGGGTPTPAPAPAPVEVP
jgi:tetratricopeptide (TPR) repeat protein